MTYAHGGVRMVRIQAKASTQMRAIRILLITPQLGLQAASTTNSPDSATACQNGLGSAQHGLDMAQHQARP